MKYTRGDSLTKAKNLLLGFRNYCIFVNLASDLSALESFCIYLLNVRKILIQSTPPIVLAWNNYTVRWYDGWVKILYTCWTSYRLGSHLEIKDVGYWIGLYISPLWKLQYGYTSEFIFAAVWEVEKYKTSYL